MNLISATITHYQRLLRKDSYSPLTVYKASEAIPYQSKLVFHISLPLIDSLPTIKTASLEFECYHTFSKNKDVQEIILAILSQIDNMKVTCSDYEKQVLQENLKMMIIKALSSVKVEEEVHEHIVLTPESNEKSIQLMNDEFVKSISIQSSACHEVSKVCISNCMSLKSITTYPNCLNKVEYVVITDCPKLVSFTIEKDTFHSAKEFLLLNCPALESVHFGAYSFQSKDCKCSISHCSVHSVVFDCFAFKRISSLSIESKQTLVTYI